MPSDSQPTDELQGSDLSVARELKRIRGLLILVAVIGVAVALFFARDVLLPIVLGLMLALTLSPVIRAAGRIGLPPPLTAVALILTVGAGIAAGGYAASGPISGWLERAPQMGEQIERKLRGLTESVEKVKQASDQVENMAEPGEGEPEKVVVESPGILNTAASYAAETATTIGIALVLAMFVLASGDMFSAKIVEAYPKLSDKKRALKIVRGVERAISHYLLTITVINAGLGVAVAMLMWVAGLPSPFIWGVVAFVFNFLPFIGAVAGVVLVAMFSVLSFDTLGAAMIPPLLYLGATSVEGQMLTPAVLGRRLQLNTVSVFLAVVVWGWLWGVAGALMAVPALVVVKVICDNVDGLRTLGSFLGGADTSVREKGEPALA